MVQFENKDIRKIINMFKKKLCRNGSGKFSNWYGMGTGRSGTEMVTVLERNGNERITALFKIVLYILFPNLSCKLTTHSVLKFFYS